MSSRIVSVLFLAATLAFAHPARANTDSANTEANSAPQLLTQEEFAFQKALMIQDTGQKVKVLQAAHDCAKAADTPAAFAQCNQQLREAILGSGK